MLSDEAEMSQFCAQYELAWVEQPDDLPGWGEVDSKTRREWPLQLGEGSRTTDFPGTSVYVTAKRVKDRKPENPLAQGKVS